MSNLNHAKSRMVESLWIINVFGKKMSKGIVYIHADGDRFGEMLLIASMFTITRPFFERSSLAVVFPFLQN